MSELLDALVQPHVQLLLRLVLGGVLLLAGVTKLIDMAAFREAVGEYDVLPQALERPFAVAVPVVETSIGVLLLIGLGTVAAAAIAGLLFLSFGAAIAINVARGRHIDCHCFGAVQSDHIGWPPLIRSLLLVAAAAVVVAGANGFGAVDTAIWGSSASLPPLVEIVPVAFMAFVVLDVLVLLPETLAFRGVLSRVRAGAHA